jgi:hypothetical protein
MSRRVAQVLRIALVLQTCGLAGGVFLGGDVLFSPALVGWGVDMELAHTMDQLCAALALAAALTVLALRVRVVAALLAALMLLAATVGGLGPAPLAYLAIPAHATRWGLPLLLALAPAESLGPRAVSPATDERRTEAILRVCIASTFAAHGLEALAMHPSFSALLQGSAARLFGADLPALAVARTLLVIGLLDLFVASAALVGPRRRIAALVWYMAIWGLITAMSRAIVFGPPGLTATLLRAANGGLPIALLLHWRSIPGALSRPRRLGWRAVSGQACAPDMG